MREAEVLMELSQERMPMLREEVDGVRGAQALFAAVARTANSQHSVA